jgi:tRNA (guanosine-2'-O-)-methyltransferase
MTQITSQPKVKPDALLVEHYGTERVIAWLSPLVEPERLTLLDQTSRARRSDLTLLLDRFYDPHNNAAVLRSAEAFGLVRVHAVPGEQGAALSATVSQGVEKWIDFDVHASTEAALSAIAADGYTLCGADVHGDPPEALASIARVCLVMGAEKPGLSALARSRCTRFVSIPMRGMVESFNVSVAAALLVYACTRDRPPLLLEEAARRTLLARYLVQTVQRPEVVLAQLAQRA